MVHVTAEALGEVAHQPRRAAMAVWLATRPNPRRAEPPDLGDLFCRVVAAATAVAKESVAALCDHVAHVVLAGALEKVLVANAVPHVALMQAVRLRPPAGL